MCAKNAIKTFSVSLKLNQSETFGILKYYIFFDVKHKK